MVVIWVSAMGVICCSLGWVLVSRLCSHRRIVRHLGSKLLVMCWLQTLGIGL